MTVETDIALIGAGPLGLEMAAALKMAGQRYVHIEAGQIGATVQWWAPGTRWFSSPERISIAGVPLVTPNQEKASREEYLAYLRSVVLQFDLKIETYTRVTHIQRPAEAGGAFVLTLQKAFKGEALGPATTLRARRVILSTGGTESPNMLGIPGEELPHVSHYFSDPHVYFQKKLLIVGGRNSAVEAAMRCHRAGAQVHFSYRGSGVDAKDIKYWLYPEFSALVKLGAAGGIVPHFETVVTELTGTHATLSPAHAGGPAARYVPVDFVLLMTGYQADMSLARMAGVELRGDQLLPVYDAETMETNVPGLYVAGTAIAGTQRRYKVFLENCHVHVPRILAALRGRREHVEGREFERPES